MKRSKVVDHLKTQGVPEYLDTITEETDEDDDANADPTEKTSPRWKVRRSL
jgi:DNA segregation ATPase FtsK/SpoIIIE-like protein